MTHFRKLFFKKVEGIRDTYVLEEGDVALDESDGKLYRGDGSTVGGVVITPSAGIGYTDISVATSSAAGGGALVYNNSTGQFTFTPAVTSATDTLDIVTGRGATTTNAITVGNILTTSDAITLGNSSSAGSEAVAIGKGTAGVGDYAQAIGNNAGNSGQGVAAVAIGSQAGETSQGTKAIAIGQYAGQTSQAANSIVINATGSALQNTTASSLVVKPIRSATNVNFLKYNSTSGEVTYDNATYLTGISGNNIAELANVHNASPSEGDVLTWDNSLSYWKPAVQTQLNLDNLSAGVVDVSADSIAIIDANDSNNSKKESIADLVTAIAGVGISATSGVLSVAIPTTFGTIAVSGQNSVTSDTSNDTLTLVAGSNMTITTDSGTDTITFASTGGGGGGLSNIVEDTTPQLGGALDTNGNNITFSGTDKAQFGTSQDLSIFHNNNHSIIRETGTGDLYLQSDNNVILSTDTSTKKMVKGVGSGEVILYHNDVQKLNTSTSGVTVVDEVHTEGATPHLTLKRTDNANVPTIRFKGSGGTIGASIDFDGTAGTSNELAFQTYDGASIAERFRVTYTGISVPYTSNIDSHEIVTSSGNTNIKIDPHGTGDIILKTDGSNGQVGVGTVAAPDTALHVKSTASIITLQRTDDSKKPGISFQNSNGNTRGAIKIDGTGGISNEIFMETYDGSTQAERFRVTHRGIRTLGTNENTFTTLTGATGVVDHDCQTADIFLHTTPAADWTANFTNLGFPAEHRVTIEIMIVQGNTAYKPTAVQIGGVAQTIIWKGNNAPTGTDNGHNRVFFHIFNDGGTYRVYGDHDTYGGV